MNIGIDARFWNESGVGRYIRNLVRQLCEIDKKNNYTLFALTKDAESIFSELNKSQPKADPPRAEKMDNGKWKIVPTNVPWHSLQEQIILPKILENENLDLMHFPYFSIPVFYNKPYIVTIHDLILHHFSTGKATTRHPLIYHGKRLGYKFILKNAAQTSKKIITVSNTTKEEIIDHLKIDPDKIIVTYEGVDLKVNSRIESNIDRKSSNILDKITTNLNGRYFLHVGNLYPHKNMEIVLKSIVKMHTNDLGFKIIIVGKEDYFYKRFQEKVKNEGLERHFVFFGEANDSQLQILYKNALALIAPSLMEGFDLPAVEAMASGCIVLASDIPVHKEICDDAAIFFNFKNVDDLIMKLNEIYKNGKDKYSKNIKRGKEISGEFNWKKMAIETLEIYKQVLSNH